MPDDSMNEALRELLERRQAEQRGMREALFGQAPPEPTKEPDADALRREAAENAAPAISFDGGARDPGPRQPPSMDSVIRSSRALRDREVTDYADQLDRDGSPWR